jgi:hypothetical protein
MLSIPLLHAKYFLFKVLAVVSKNRLAEPQTKRKMASKYGVVFRFDDRRLSKLSKGF